MNDNFLHEALRSSVKDSVAPSGKVTNCIRLNILLAHSPSLSMQDCNETCKKKHKKPSLEPLF